ncbi:hypothetical protein MBLNU459_g3970t1 [Dothideomycetes sp. NU459]
METASLTLAHSHARSASQNTSKARLTVAASEHESAAGEFAKTALGTGDPEALRLLKLMEEHHHKLAQIIRSKDAISKAVSEASQPLLTDALPPATEKTSGSEDDVAPTSPPVPEADPGQEKTATSPLARTHNPRRDSSPALAKDIASRRGIPQPSQRKMQTAAPGVSAVIAEGRMTTTQPASTFDPPARRQPQSTRPDVPAPVVVRDRQAPAASADDGFARFYSNLTAGPFSRISSMLAFAALPLTESTHPDSPTESRTEKTTARATNDPSVESLISPAALHALQEHQRTQGGSGHSFGQAESFYLIPPTGGTASYANIVNREQRYARREHLSDISEEADGEFVDARETQSRRAPPHQARTAASFKEEELQLENETLKQVLDKMSHRLQAFESHAQDASMAALTQSMASVRTQPSAPPDMSDERKAMEDEMRRAAREIAKLKSINSKYKAYLENLKNNARAKEKEKRGKVESNA